MPPHAVELVKGNARDGLPRAAGLAARLRVNGMHCAGCVGKVESALRRVPGVADAEVSLTGAMALVRGQAGEQAPDTEALVEAVRSTGFTAEPMERRESLAERREAMERRRLAAVRRWKWRVIVGGAVWLPLEMLHWFGPSIGIHTHHPSGGLPFWIGVVASLAVFAYVGSAFYVSAFRAARSRSTNMDTLIAIGATAAIGLSVFNLARALSGVADLPLYFTEAAGLLTLIALGHWLEAHMTARAGSALHDLLSLQPDEVVKLASPDAAEGAVTPTESVMPGDHVLIRPGERIAVDGEIVRGSSSIDESVVTGESIPVDRTTGGAVVAGAMNLTGRLVVRATSDGTETTIARIAEIVINAQSGRTHIQRLADRVAAVFVPAVLAIAAVTLLGWGVLTGDWITGLVSATTVLVISCPCALGLAAPTAVMVASGAASRTGVLVRSPETFERAAAVRVVAFDKTGTLTRGTPRVVEADDEPLALAAALATSSSHPLSVAISDAARERSLDVAAVSDLAETPGVGLSGLVRGTRVEVISTSTATRRGIDFPESPDDASVSVVLTDGQVAGVIAFRDEPRDDAAALLQTLAAEGIETHLLSGDRSPVVESIAQDLGIDAARAHGGLSPEDKVARVRELAEAAVRSGGTLAMIGDGINDAAALAEAGARGGIGIAMGTGTNVAIESADVVIPGDRLGAVLDVLGIARRTLRTIKQNLALAFVYNSLAIPAAAFGLLGVHGPIIAALAMAVSDASVLGNSLRLAAGLRRRERQQSDA